MSLLNHTTQKIGLFLILLFLLSISVFAAVDDLDEDTISNTYDVCPNTPADAILVDPVEHIDYAGCSCAQIEEIVNITNPCITYYCQKEVLKLSPKLYDGERKDCQEDYCDGYTLYDFPDDGYPYCQQGKLIHYSCDPTITDRSELCGYVENNESVAVEEEELVYEDFILLLEELPQQQIYPLADETEGSYLTFTYDAVPVNGFITLRLVLLSSNPSVDLFFTQGDELLATADDATVNYADYEGGAKRALYAEWQLPVIQGYDSFYANVTATLGTQGTQFQEQLLFALETEVTPFSLPRIDVEIIGNSFSDMITYSDEEIAFLRALYSEVYEKKLYTGTFDDFKAGTKRAAENLDIEDKEYVFSEGKTTTYIRFTPLGKKSIAREVYVFEYVPKEVAASLDDMIVSGDYVPIQNDPLIMWHFSAVSERVDLDYATVGENSFTGNTVVVVEEYDNGTVWHIILPMLLIPLLIFVLIIAPHMRRHKK